MTLRVPHSPFQHKYSLAAAEIIHCLLKAVQMDACSLSMRRKKRYNKNIRKRYLRNAYNFSA